MTNEDNPYGNFLEIIRKEAHADGDAPFFIGTVVQPNPLIVKIGDLQIERENMKVNQALLASYSRRMSMGITFSTAIFPFSALSMVTPVMPMISVAISRFSSLSSTRRIRLPA